MNTLEQNIMEDTIPKFSIVIPIFKGMPQAKIAIASAVSQTVENLNVVILENGKCENLRTYIKELNDPRLILHSYEDVVGIEENWARITKLDLGKYMTIIGHDDELYPGYLECIDELIREFPNRKLYGTSGILVNNNGSRLSRMRVLEGELSLEGYLEARFNFHLDVSGTGFVYASEDFKANGGFPKFPKLFFSDDAFWLSLLQKGNGVIVGEAQYNVMIHDDSASFTHPKIGVILTEGLVAFNQFLLDKIDTCKQQYWQSLRKKFMKKYLLKTAILVSLDDYKKGRHERNFGLVRKSAKSVLGRRQIFFDMKICLIYTLLRFFMLAFTPTQIMDLLKKIKSLIR